jgi:hypothetical protein
MHFCRFTQYCRSNTAVDIAMVIKISTSPTGIKYKFGMQVPKEIKNEIHLDNKNGNQLKQKAINTELKQLTDYQTFIVLDSRKDILTGYHLKHEARIVVDVNWTVNDKENIYSGVVRMDTVRIGFFLRRAVCMDFHVVYVTSEMPSCKEKQKRKSI